MSENPTWLPEEQQAEIEGLESKAREDEGAAVEAETKAENLRNDALAALAKANEAREIHDALAKIAAASAHYAERKRADADAQKAIDGNDAGRKADVHSGPASHDGHEPL